MSYDISFRAKIENKPTYLTIPYIDSANITWNVRELIRQSSGWDILNCQSNGLVVDWIIKIKKGIVELETKPELYKQYEAKNGWGTVEGTLNFYKRCERMFNDFIAEYEELSDVAVVWVD